MNFGWEGTAFNPSRLHQLANLHLEETVIDESECCSHDLIERLNLGCLGQARIRQPRKSLRESGSRVAGAAGRFRLRCGRSIGDDDGGGVWHARHTFRDKADVLAFADQRQRIALGRLVRIARAQVDGLVAGGAARHDRGQRSDADRDYTDRAVARPGHGN